MTQHTINSGNEKAPGLPSEGSSTHTINTRKFSAKSTATEAQYDRIVSMLRAGKKDTMKFRRAGIMSPASRIKELNDRFGFYISSNPIDLWDEWGYCHKGVALYELIDEPKEGGQHHV